MVAPRPSKTHLGNRKLAPETLMLGYGYDPMLSEGAVKPPVFLTSTFVFQTAEQGCVLLAVVAKQPGGVTEIGTIEPGDMHPGRAELERRGDIRADLWGGGGGERRGDGPAESLANLCKAHVVGTKVVSPEADAVSFVHHEQARFQFRQ